MSTFTDVREQMGNKMNFGMEIFKEPRGIMRILQIIFSFFTALVLRSYEGYVDIQFCKDKAVNVHLPIQYPFDLVNVKETVTCSNTSYTISLQNDFSSEAEFLFTACWVSIIYVIIIAFVYVKFREDYESNGNLALVDFVVSLILAVLWISSFGSWSYGQSQLKSYTNPDYLKANLPACTSDMSCVVTRGTVAGLTQTMILSFLNFFLWAAGLWFLYKETPWYLQFQRA